MEKLKTDIYIPVLENLRVCAGSKLHDFYSLSCELVKTIYFTARQLAVDISALRHA
jgi:hypothetical protein